MSDPSQQSGGIDADILAFARGALRNALDLLPSIETIETRKAYRRIGPSTVEIGEETYVGALTFVNLWTLLSQQTDISAFAAIVAARQPELAQYIEVDGGSHPIGGAEGLLRGWLFLLIGHKTRGEVYEHHIDQLLSDATNLVASRKIKHIVQSPLCGLRMPDGIDTFSLEPGVSVRLLNVKEQTRVMSGDHGDSSHHFTDWIECALEVEFDDSLRFNERQLEVASKPIRELARSIRADFLHALHILLPGHVRPKYMESRIVPSALPNLGERGKEWQQTLGRYAVISLGPSDVEDLRRLYLTLKSAPGKVGARLRRAAKRLMEAEGRVDPGDVVLDCVTSLELLLGGPIFRFSMNYAALHPQDGIDRFNTANALYATRNPLAHGGDSDATEVQAQIAKSCLRDVLQRLLSPDAPSLETIEKQKYWASIFPQA